MPKSGLKVSLTYNLFLLAAEISFSIRGVACS